MEGVDKEKVQRVVYEMSKGSKYFQNEERKEAFIKQKVDNFRVQCAKLSQADLSHYQKVIYSLFSLLIISSNTNLYPHTTIPQVKLTDCLVHSCFLTDSCFV